MEITVNFVEVLLHSLLASWVMGVMGNIKEK